MSQLQTFFDGLKRFFNEEPIAGMILRADTPIRLSVVMIGLVLASGLSGFLFAMIKPANAANLFFFQSWAFWSLHSAAGFSFVLIAELVLLQSTWKRWIRATLTLALLPFFLAPFSIYLDGAFHALDVDTVISDSPFQIYIGEVLDVAPLSIVLTGLAIWLFQFLTPTVRSSDEGSDPTTLGARLYEVLDGFPAALGEDVIRLEAQDHYTLVVTSLGQHLLSKSLSDCMAALKRFDGLQTHRSHWANLRHIEALEPRGSAFECVLSNEDRVPISRRRYSMLRHLLRAKLEEQKTAGKAVAKGKP